MAESKRTFQRPGINRDLDDRLLPDGMYRDGLNINVGRSEGDDVGALENTKGNELIAGQEDVFGTTIGTVVDPANDKLYWFTTSDAVDAVYEYDGSEIAPVIIDRRTSDIPLPTCVPTLEAFITGPDSGRPGDPLLPAIPPTVSISASQTSVTYPFGGTPPNVTISANIINGSSSNYTYAWNDGSTAAPPRTINSSVSGLRLTITADDGGTATSNAVSVTFTEEAPPAFSVNAGADQTIANGASATLTATATGAVGNVTYSWTPGGATTRSFNTGALTASQTYTVTATDSGAGGRTASDTVHVMVEDAAPPPSDPVAPTVTINGATAAMAGDDVTLTVTETAGELTGGTAGTFQSRMWTVNPASATTSDLTGTSIVVNRADDGNVDVSVRSVFDTGTATDTHRVVYSALPIFTTSFTSNTPGNTAVVDGGDAPSVTGVAGTSYTFSSVISANTGFRFDNAPTWAVTGGNATPTSGTGETASVTGTLRSMADTVALTWSATAARIFTPTCSVEDGTTGEAVSFTTNLENATVNPATYQTGLNTYTITGDIPTGFSMAGTETTCSDMATGTVAAPVLTISNIGARFVNPFGSNGQFGLAEGVHAGFSFDWELSGVDATPFFIQITGRITPESTSPSGQMYFTFTSAPVNVQDIFTPVLSGSANIGGRIAGPTPGVTDGTGLQVWITEQSRWTVEVIAAQTSDGVTATAATLAGTLTRSGVLPPPSNA